MQPVLKTIAIWRRKTGYVYQDMRALLGLTANTVKAARGARIVVYHGICQNDHLRFNNIFLRRATFEEHLRCYKEYFNLVSLEDYYQGRFSNDRFNICLSFDDGFANNHSYVLPLLEQYQVPAAFFITAIREAGYDILWNDFLGLLNKYGPDELVFRQESFRKHQGLFSRYVSLQSGIGLRETLISQGFGPKAALIGAFGSLIPLRGNEDYWLQMTGDQIRELAASPWVTIGAHGYYHNDLSKINIADAEQEMFGCKQYLERITGKEIQALAFPYGTYTAAVVGAAKRAGFSQLLPLDIHYPDPALRDRVIVNPYVSITNQLLNIIKRRYDFWR
jgi:peptidoglycan/xylan/chitin deacetylase (PgdA/CDA1 family)